MGKNVPFSHRSNFIKDLFLSLNILVITQYIVFVKPKKLYFKSFFTENRYMDTSFWDRTNALIKKLNKTQNGVSTECGFNSRRIQNLSGANRAPDVFEAYKIAQALNTTVEYLVTGEDTSPYKQELDKLKAAIIPVLDL